MFAQVGQAPGNPDLGVRRDYIMSALKCRSTCAALSTPSQSTFLNKSIVAKKT